jgi:hypothetical protein
MHSDPEPEGSLAIIVCCDPVQRILHFDGALDGVDCTRELGQDTVARCVGNPPTMLDNQAVHDLAVGRQRLKGCDLILVHEPGVTSDIGGKNGR